MNPHGPCGPTDFRTRLRLSPPLLSCRRVWGLDYPFTMFPKSSRKIGRSVHLPLWGRQDRDLWSDYVPISSSPNQAQRSHGVILPLVRLGEIRALGRRLAAYHAHPREAVAREWNYALKSRRQFELILKRRQRQGRGRCRRIATATLTATPEAALSRPATPLPTLLINISGDFSRLLGRLSDSSKSPESSKRLRSSSQSAIFGDSPRPAGAIGRVG